MQDQLEKLREIGVREIAKATKISIAKLEDILQKRFKNIQRVRAQGFLNILEREYKVDLSDWLKEYDESLQKTRCEEGQNYLDNLDLDTQKRKDDLKVQRQKRLMSKKRFYLCVGIAIVLLLGYFSYKSFFIHNQVSKQSINDNKSDNLASIGEETPTITTTTKESLKPLKEEDSLEIVASQASVSNGEESDISQSTQETTLEEVNSQNTSTTQIPILFLTQTSLDGQSAQKNQIIIKPEKKLWVEVQNLSTHKKDSKIIETSFVIESSKDRLLISLGHGEVSVIMGDKDTQYNVASPLRFLYSPKKGLERIKYSEYLNLSGSNGVDKTSD